MRLSTLRSLGLVLLLGCACSRDAGEAGQVEVTVAGSARTWTRAELAALPVSTVEVAGQRYTGVALPALLPALGLSTDAPLVATAADGYAQELAPATLTREDALLVYALADAALPAGEGPLRLVVPGARGLSVKQLVRLEQRRGP